VAGWYVYDFIDVSIGNVIERVWFIDGDSIFGEEVLTYEFHEPGYYAVCLVIVTDEGCHDQYCMELYVGGSSGDCYADFGYYPMDDIILAADSTDMLIMGFPYQFYDRSVGEVVEWTWTFGDDIIKGDSIPMYVFPFPGEYEVCLTIVTSDNCVSTQCQTVVVGPSAECQAMFEYYNPLDIWSVAPDFPGSTVLQFVDMSKGEITKWYWDFGDGTHSREQNPIHEFPHTGEFVVCLTVSSPDGCEDTYCTVVHFDPWLECNAYFEYCPYQIISTDSTINKKSYIIGFKNLSTYNVIQSVWGIPDVIHSEWDFGDGTSSTEHNPLHVYQRPGVYQVCLTIYSWDGCYDTYCRRVYVGIEECKVDFTHEIIVPDCWGYETAHYFVAITTEEPWSYFWDFGDGYYGYEEEVAHAYANEGYYDVCLEVTYSNGCVASKCKSILNSTLVNDSVYFEKCNPSAIEYPQADQVLSVTNVYPVPASEILNIDLYSENNSTIDINLINTLGQKTSLSENYSISAGDNQLELHLGKLEPGTYIYVISSSDNVIRGRVSIIQ
jgi:PKD repeat protein